MDDQQLMVSTGGAITMFELSLPTRVKDEQQLRVSTGGDITTFELSLPTRVTISLAGGPIVTIHADGTVEAPTLEHASEAGRVLVDSMRTHLRGMI